MSRVLLDESDVLLLIRTGDFESPVQRVAYYRLRRVLSPLNGTVAVVSHSFCSATNVAVRVASSNCDRSDFVPSGVVL